MQLNLSTQLLPELRTESEKTRRLFEALPEDQNAFRPHVKSMPLARLAGHIADFYRVIVLSLTSPDFDWANWSPYTMNTKAELLVTLAKKSRDALSALENASNEVFHQQWRICRGDRDLFCGVRYTAYRSNGMNQIIHHRAQLGTYIRALDHPLPGMYGPSADGI